jgi:hypothetical protein
MILVPLADEVGRFCLNKK